MILILSRALFYFISLRCRRAAHIPRATDSGAPPPATLPDAVARAHPPPKLPDTGARAHPPPMLRDTSARP